MAVQPAVAFLKSSNDSCLENILEAPRSLQRPPSVYLEPLRLPPLNAVGDDILRPFTWQAVFERVEHVWRQLS